MINRYALKVWYRDFLVWTRYWWTSLIGGLGEPVLYFVGMGYGLGSFIEKMDGMPYLQFLAPALMASAIMHSASFETTYSSYTRMEVQKTFHSIAVTPVNIGEVVAGEILWGATKSLIAGTMMLIAIGGAGLIHSWMVVWLIPVWLMEAILFASLGMLMTSFAQDYDFFTYYITLFLEPMFIFSGTFFPLHKLPDVVQKIAWILPLSHPVTIARGLFLGQWTPEMLLRFGWMTLMTIGIFYWAVRRMVKRLVV